MRRQYPALVVALALQAFGSLASGADRNVAPLLQRPPDIPVERMDRPPRQRPTQERPLNLNTASHQDLVALPGIDDAVAGAIIQARPYQRLEELLEKKILSPDTYHSIHSLITVTAE